MVTSFAASSPPDPTAFSAAHACDPAALRPCPCVAALRVPVDPARRSDRTSGYRNVYSAHSETHPWRAKVKLGGRLVEVGRAALPHQAAVYVVKWYREQFGPNWRAALAGRKRPKGWRVLRDPEALFPTWVSWRAVEEQAGRWTLSVWEWGREVTVREVKRGGRWRVPVPRKAKAGCKPPGRVKVFASRDAAAAHVLRWVVERWGLFAFLAVRRG